MVPDSPRRCNGRAPLLLISTLAITLSPLFGCSEPPTELRGSWPVYRTLPPVPVGLHPNTLVATDLDLDGDIDIAVPAVLDTSLVILENDGAGQFEPTAATPLGVEPGGDGAIDASAADLDGDGVPELAMTTFANNRVALLASRPDSLDGAWSVAGDVDVAGEPACLAIADVVGDGHLDMLVTRGQENDLLLLAGDGALDFVLAGRVELGRRPTAVLAFDGDDDGAVEIAVVSSIANELAILAVAPGSGEDRAYRQVASAPLSGWPASVIAADLNGDERPELIGATNLGNTLFVAHLAGDIEGGNLSITIREQPVGRGAFGVAAADFDGDGLIDVAVAEKFANTVTLLRNVNGALEPQATYQVGEGPTPIAARDLDGDGIPDLVVANGFSNDVTVLLSSFR